MWCAQHCGTIIKIFGLCVLVRSLCCARAVAHTIFNGGVLHVLSALTSINTSISIDLNMFDSSNLLCSCGLDYNTVSLSTQRVGGANKSSLKFVECAEAPGWVRRELAKNKLMLTQDACACWRGASKTNFGRTGLNGLMYDKVYFFHGASTTWGAYTITKMRTWAPPPISAYVSWVRNKYILRKGCCRPTRSTLQTDYK